MIIRICVILCSEHYFCEKVCILAPLSSFLMFIRFQPQLVIKHKSVNERKVRITWVYDSKQPFVTPLKFTLSYIIRPLSLVLYTLYYLKCSRGHLISLHQVQQRDNHLLRYYQIFCTWSLFSSFNLFHWLSLQFFSQIQILKYEMRYRSS